jgi:hypothetical protein
MLWNTLGAALGWKAPRVVVLSTLAVAVAAAVLLAAPGQTVSARYLNDLMIFLDGGYRMASGQVPHRDFHTPMGPLVSLLPAAGLLLTGSFGAAMPLGVALLILVLAPVMAHVLSSRLRPAIALPTAVYLSLILAAPANLGEPPQILSFAMFYNRVGWAAFAVLLVMFLTPTGGRAAVGRDALSAAVLTLIMLYTKATYGVVALAFLVLMLHDRNQWRWAIAALALTVAATLALEAVSGVPSAYVSDLARATHASGPVKEGSERLLTSFAENLFDYALFAVVAALAAAMLRDWRMLAFLAFCGGAGLMIQNQNFQVTGIVTLAAGAVVVVEAMARQHRRAERPAAGPALAAASVLAALFLLPMIADRAVALGTHAALASTRPAHRFGLHELDRIVLAHTGTVYDVRYTWTYVATLDDGARALASLGPFPGGVVVLDFCNPFSAGLGLPAPRGDYTATQFGRTFDKEHFVPPEIALREAGVVMEPKWQLDTPSVEAFLELYGTYLAENFELSRETEYWKIYLRRPTAAAPAASQSRRVQ